MDVSLTGTHFRVFQCSEHQMVDFQPQVLSWASQMDQELSSVESLLIGLDSERWKPLRMRVTAGNADDADHANSAGRGLVGMAGSSAATSTANAKATIFQYDILGREVFLDPSVFSKPGQIAKTYWKAWLRGFNPSAVVPSLLAEDVAAEFLWSIQTGAREMQVGQGFGKFFNRGKESFLGFDNQHFHFARSVLTSVSSEIPVPGPFPEGTAAIPILSIASYCGSDYRLLEHRSYCRDLEGVSSSDFALKQNTIMTLKPFLLRELQGGFFNKSPRERFLYLRSLVQDKGRSLLVNLSATLNWVSARVARRASSGELKSN